MELFGLWGLADAVRAGAIDCDPTVTVSRSLVDGPDAALPLLRDTAERAGRLRLTGLQAMAELFAAADAGLTGDEQAMAGWLASAVSRPDAPTEVTTLGPMVRALPHLLRHDLPRASALLDDAVPALLAHGSAIPMTTSGCGRCCAPRSATGTGPPARSSAVTSR